MTNKSTSESELAEPVPDDTEKLHTSSERFRLKLIRDFRILENLTEEEANYEAPKYHAQAYELNWLGE